MEDLYPAGSAVLCPASPLTQQILQQTFGLACLVTKTEGRGHHWHQTQQLLLAPNPGAAAQRLGAVSCLCS